MSEIVLRADTPAELKARLAELDIDVPLRSEGRRNHHAERYCIAPMLATLPVEQLSFPLTLIHSDKPDFLLAMPSTDVGIEHTEAVPENIARADFLREKEGLGPDVYFSPPMCCLGSPGRQPMNSAVRSRPMSLVQAGVAIRRSANEPPRWRTMSRKRCRRQWPTASFDTPPTG